MVDQKGTACVNGATLRREDRYDINGNRQKHGARAGGGRCGVSDHRGCGYAMGGHGGGGGAFRGGGFGGFHGGFGGSASAGSAVASAASAAAVAGVGVGPTQLTSPTSILITTISTRITAAALSRARARGNR